MLEYLTMEVIGLILILIVVVLVLYKLFKVILKLVIAGAAGFAAPWVLSYLGIGINPTFGLSFNLMLIAILIVLILEFLHLIKYFIRLILWPFKRLLGRNK